MNTRRKRNDAKRILLSVILMLAAVALLAGIVYFGHILAEKNEKTRLNMNSMETSGDPADASEENLLSDETSAENRKEQSDEESGSVTTAADVEKAQGEDSGEPLEETKSTGQESVPVGDQIFTGGFTVHADEQTILVGDTDVLSKHTLLVDLSDDRIVAWKDAQTRIYPASMTKILTILVAAEHMTDPDELFTIPQESVAYCLSNGCSAAGFVTGENVPVRDLFYGTILPSGGEAAVALAMYTAGTHEAFVELMNKKLQELGLSENSHMTNCVGVYDDAHYCTMQDMAMILKAAVENDFCREVLQTHVYYTTKTEQNPEGIILSNWFLRRIEDKDCHGTVVGAKTGFVNQSGDCAASYFVSNSGKPYICVTADTYNSWRCIYDHVAMYSLYTA